MSSDLIVMLDAIRLEIRAASLACLTAEAIKVGITGAPVEHYGRACGELTARADDLAHMATTLAFERRES